MSGATELVRVDAPMTDIDRPAESWVVNDEHGGTVARGSIWTTGTPVSDGGRIGLIGHYDAADAHSARILLDHLSSRLAAAGCSRAIGPMDGSTWRRYRLVVEFSEPPFFLDVDNPDQWPAHFRESGFNPVASYFSTRVDLATRDPRVDRTARRLEDAGVRIRQIDQSRLEDEMRAIHTLSLVAFRDAYLYTPIGAAAFASLYRPLLPRVDPRFVLMAENEGTLAGMVFTMPDANEPARGLPLRTLVVKTLAVLPDRIYAGLGAVLLARVHENGLGTGLTSAIHALMHESNKSRALSGHWNGQQIRRYELFGRDLAP